MFYILLFWTCSLFGAALQHSSSLFYSDSSLRNMRKSMLPLVTKGPVRELDAYLTYVSDIANLSTFELANKPLEKHRKKLLLKVYRDQFELSNTSFFGLMAGVKGVHCVESVIEFGLRCLKGCALSPVEIKAYRLLNDMIVGLARTLSCDEQRKFWIEWIAQAETYEDKVLMFDLYMDTQKNLQGVHAKLKQYNKLLKNALQS